MIWVIKMTHIPCTIVHSEFSNIYNIKNTINGCLADFKIDSGDIC